MPSSLDIPLEDVLGLPAPADLCRTSISKRYKLIYVNDLDESEWNDEPTRPVCPNALRVGS
jgi:hypothetical protein